MAPLSPANLSPFSALVELPTTKKLEQWTVSRIAGTGLQRSGDPHSPSDPAQSGDPRKVENPQTKSTLLFPAGRNHPSWPIILLRSGSFIFERGATKSWSFNRWCIATHRESSPSFAGHAPFLLCAGAQMPVCRVSLFVNGTGVNN